MPLPTSPFRVTSFLGLVDDVPATVPPDAQAILKNLYRDRKKVVRRGGTAKLWEPRLGAATLDGLAWFRLDASDCLFAAWQGSLYHSVTGGVGPTLLTNGTGKLTAGRPASFAWVAGAVYAGDGTAQNVRLTSTRADQALPAAPSTGPVAADGGAGAMSAGTYSYKVTFLSASGVETDPGPASNALVQAGSRQINLTSIPVAPAAEDCSGRRIYRTSDAGTTYLRVTTISNNTATTYTDNTADLTGNTALATGRTRFPPCKILEQHHHRLLGAGCATAAGDKRTVYISNFGEPEIAPASPDLETVTDGTQIALSGDVDGEITAIKSHGDKAWVWTAGSMHALTGDLPLDFSLQPFAHVGCVGHRTVCSIRDGLYWLAPDGIYRAAEGQAMERISDPVAEFIESLTAADYEGAAAVCWDNRYYLLTPSGCRWYDTDYGIWGENTAWNWKLGAAGGFRSGQKPKLYGASPTEGQVWELEIPNSPYDDGVVITTQLATADLDFGLPGREKRLHYIGAVWKAGSGQANVNIAHSTGATAETLTQDLSETPVTGGSISRMLARVGSQHRSEFFAAAVTSATTAETYEILAIDGQWTLAK